MYKLALCRLYIRRLGLIALLVIIVNGLITFVFKPLTDGVTKEQIAHNLVYYEGLDVARYEQYAIDNDLEYNLSPSVHGQKDFITTLGEDAIEPIYLYDLNYLKDTSKDLITSNLDILNKDNEKFIDMSNIYISVFPSDINDYQTYNERLEIEQVLVGNYPSKDNELLIPEVYAISIANELGVESYEQLLDQSIELMGKKYKIVGVYSGSSHIITYPSQEQLSAYNQYLNEAIFIKFDNDAQKKAFFKQFNSSEFVNSSDFYFENVMYILPQFLQGLVLLLSILFISKEQKQYTRILDHHNHTFSNSVLPLLLPSSVLVVLTLLI